MEHGNLIVEQSRLLKKRFFNLQAGARSRIDRIKYIFVHINIITLQMYFLFPIASRYVIGSKIKSLP